MGAGGLGRPEMSQLTGRAGRKHSRRGQAKAAHTCSPLNVHKREAHRAGLRKSKGNECGGPGKVMRSGVAFVLESHQKLLSKGAGIQQFKRIPLCCGNR